MDNTREAGDDMAETIEERLTRLERQTELNRNNINLLIDMLNQIAEKVASAAGQMAKMPRIPSPRNRGDAEN